MSDLVTLIHNCDHEHKVMLICTLSLFDPDKSSYSYKETERTPLAGNHFTAHLNYALLSSLSDNVKSDFRSANTVYSLY